MMSKLPNTYLCYTDTSHTSLLIDGEADAARNGNARDSVISSNNLTGGSIK